MSEKSKTYKVDCKCSNCGFSGPVAFPFGTLVNTGSVKCPTCGCTTLFCLLPHKVDCDGWSWDRHPFKRYLSGDTTLPAISMNKPDTPKRPGDIWMSMTPEERAHPGCQDILFERAIEALL